MKVFKYKKTKLAEFQGYDEERYDMLHTERREKTRRFVMRTLFWFISIPVVILAAAILCLLMIKKTTMNNRSMEPTLSQNDRIVINTLTYRLSSPERFDVIVIDKKDSEHSYYDIKRIYGLPGETVQIKDGDIYINDVLIEDKVYAEKMELAGTAKTPLKLGEGEYFVLADDRNGSEDSRYSNYGLVKEKDIIGKAWIRLGDFGFISMFNRAEDHEDDKLTVTPEPTKSQGSTSGKQSGAK